MIGELKESKSNQPDKRPEEGDRQVGRNQQEPMRFFDLDSDLVDCIILDEADERAERHRPNLTLLLDRYTSALMRVKIIKIGVIAR